MDSQEFLRAAEALTGAPISSGNQAELLINGDSIFPAMLETIASAERTLNIETYVYGGATLPARSQTRWRRGRATESTAR